MPSLAEESNVLWIWFNWLHQGKKDKRSRCSIKIPNNKKLICLWLKRIRKSIILNYIGVKVLWDLLNRKNMMCWRCVDILGYLRSHEILFYCVISVNDMKKEYLSSLALRLCSVRLRKALIVPQHQTLQVLFITYNYVHSHKIADFTHYLPSEHMLLALGLGWVPLYFGNIIISRIIGL